MKDSYVVETQFIPDTPVYKCRPQYGRKGERTLHRNLLLPVFSLPIGKLNRKKHKGRSNDPMVSNQQVIKFCRTDKMIHCLCLKLQRLNLKGISFPSVGYVLKSLCTIEQSLILTMYMQVLKVA